MTTLHEQQEELIRAVRKLGLTIWVVYEPMFEWLLRKLERR